MANVKDIKVARKAIEKQLKVLSGVYAKLTGEKPIETSTPKFRVQLDAVKEAMEALDEPIIELEGLLDEPEEE